MTPRPTRVLYVLGFPRSGSTLLGRLLADQLELPFVGELRHFWHRWSRPDPAQCACREYVVDCPHWRRVGELLADSTHGPTVDLAVREALTLQGAATRWTRLPALLAAEPPDDAIMAAYIERLRRLYLVTAEHFGAGGLVDTSKKPLDAAYLRHVRDLDVWYVHLLRDPRATAHSRSKGRVRKRDRHPSPLASRLDSYWLLHDGVNWQAGELAARKVLDAVAESRRLTLRYEDFAARPAEELNRIIDWFGCSRKQANGSSTFSLTANHAVAGNRMRYLSGPVEVRADTSWTREMHPIKQRLVAAVTRPGRRRAGYA